METKQKTRLGLVVKDKMDKTVVVAVETPKRHPLYKKTIRRVTKYKAHDEENKCQRGDKVRIVEVRPLSRDKRWRVVEIVSKGEVVEISPEEITQEELAKIQPEKKKAKKEVAEVKAEAEPEKKTKKKAKKEVAEVKAEAEPEKKKAKEEVAEVKAEVEPEEKA
jgi:small subunit ribosomal protein S17